VKFLNHALFVACAATAAAAAAAASAQPAAPPEPQRQFPLVTREGPWALPRPGRITGGPDWSNYEIYPRAALEQDLQGVVIFAVQVAADGRVRACGIIGSSGFAELDDGTCTLAMTMRFEPRRDESGRAVESAYRTRVTWVLSDLFRLVPGRLTVSFDVANGHAANCRTSVEGSVQPAWAKTGCRMVGGDLGYFLGAARDSARHAAVTVTVRPSGDTTRWPAAQGTPIARRRTEFALTEEGDPIDCRTVAESGFGPHGFDYSGPCGLFLTQSWLEPAAGQGLEDRGAVEIETYVER